MEHANNASCEPTEIENKNDVVAKGNKWNNRVHTLLS
jgi:hypothetical protein